MNISDIVEQCKTLPIAEEREITDDFAEFVVNNEDIQKWYELLRPFLGDAAKPEGTAPTDEQAKITDQFGGIFKSQTLFQKDFAGYAILAMFWPWGNDVNTTLKIVKVTL